MFKAVLNQKPSSPALPTDPNCVSPPRRRKRFEMPLVPHIGSKKFAQSQNQLNGKISNADRRGDFFARRQRIAQQRKSLPIASVEKRLVEEVRNNDTLIIVGETGSGKTTQLPQFLFNWGILS
ncbi:hypothetical protein F0562_032991 [Nyssa sinensis]|uniref:RNA helicase n=1 Tax=Nyssa sinensis TaxID=561372 RepID=A0A5J5AT36_9ASTE|nr:hypothetical protein F0562_032991 [Nyssa sinensis]